MKDTYYFSHDYNARSDDKIKQLIRKHGYLGYGIFWALVEDLYNNSNLMQMDCDGIAIEMRTQCEIINSIINDFGLFKINGNKFSSDSVKRRLNERKDKSIKARESAAIRWKNANAMRTHSTQHSDRNAIKERKGKENILLAEIKNIWNGNSEFDYIAKFFPKLFLLKEPLLPEQHKRLVAKYGRDSIFKVYAKMQNNRRLIQNNESAYLTSETWIDNDKPAKK